MREQAWNRPEKRALVRLPHSQRMHFLLQRCSGRVLPVGSTEESCVDPLVHGLEDGDVRDSGRWAKAAPLHAGTYDA